MNIFSEYYASLFRKLTNHILSNLLLHKVSQKLLNYLDLKDSYVSLLRFSPFSTITFLKILKVGQMRATCWALNSIQKKLTVSLCFPKHPLWSTVHLDWLRAALNFHTLLSSWMIIFPAIQSYLVPIYSKILYHSRKLNINLLFLPVVPTSSFWKACHLFLQFVHTIPVYSVWNN